MYVVIPESRHRRDEGKEEHIGILRHLKHCKGEVKEEEKPEAGSAAIRNPAFRLLSLRSGLQDTSPILLCTGLEKSL